MLSDQGGPNQCESVREWWTSNNPFGGVTNCSETSDKATTGVNSTVNTGSFKPDSSGRRTSVGDLKPDGAVPAGRWSARVPMIDYEGDVTNATVGGGKSDLVGPQDSAET